MDTLFTAPEIVVEAPRARGHDAFRRSGFVAVLDLGERRRRVEDLSTLLSQAVGIRVRQYGGLGSFATVSIRGSSASQVDIFLDGVPLGDGYTGIANLGDLPLDGIERVEVYRGSAPPHLGSTAIGGSLNLVSRGPKRGAERRGVERPAPLRGLVSGLEAQTSYGSFGTSRGVLSLWLSPPSTELFLHGSYAESEGDFEYVDNTGTPHNPDDDVETTRRNNAFTSWNLLGRGSTALPYAGRLTVSHNALLREQGVPGAGSFQSRSARSERERHLSHLLVESPAFAGGRARFSADGFYSWSNEKFHDPDGEISLLSQDTDNALSSYGGNARGRIELPRVPLSLELFYEGKRDRFNPRSNLPQPSEGPERNRRTHHAAATVDLSVPKLPLVLTAARRFVRQTTEFYDPPRFPWLPPTPQGEVSQSVDVPQYGFRYQALPFLAVKGNWGRYFRQPTMLELFGNVGSVTGNAALEPERGLNRDLGFVLSLDRWWKARRLFLEAAYLDNKVEDLILFFPNSQYTSRPENIGSARVRGVELSFSSHLGDRFRFSGNYTRLEGQDTGPVPYYNGNAPPGQPENEAALFADFSLGRWRLGYEYHHIGSNFLDRANLTEVPARDLHGLALRTALHPDGVSVTVEGRNLTDDRVSDVNGFPLPGRSVYVTLSVELSAEP